MNPIIRKAAPSDSENILDLLSQVENVHHVGRPDIFRKNGTKFTNSELIELMSDSARPIFVAELEGEVVGYIFCIIREIKNSTMLNDTKTIHLEDVCVDENHRGKHIGSALMEYVLNYAREIGCDRADLDVWEFNDSARTMYEKFGFATQKRRMDITL
ncbi:MAG: GNAT family N-acetyltransferase [Clostridiales bacterium]|nr:GNAT family N-acetyltransferase [Clostridiales bacterium]